MYGASTSAIPSSRRMIDIPSTKSFGSGTWARTLFASSTSACFPSDRKRAARSDVKNSCNVGMPIASAALAGPTAGSIPRTGIPALAKFWSR